MREIATFGAPTDSRSFVSPLDDHVMIGGHYFDILGRPYTLTPSGSESTELHIRMSYRVSKKFNWYTKAVAQFLNGNCEDVILEFYRPRAFQG